MQQNKSTAAVDNDFINHLVEANISDDMLVKDVSLALEALKLSAVVNPFVYEKEVANDKRTKLLFNENVLKKIELTDIFKQGQDAKEYYIYLVEELFRSLKGYSLPVKGEKVLTYWQRMSSLGEIHSMAMCAVCSYGMFLSDDADSIRLKQFLKQKFGAKIYVYNRKDFFEKVENQTSVHIPRKERRKLTHERS